MNNTFEQRTDGFWYAPPKDPRDTLDYPIDLTGLLEGDPLDFILSVTVTVADVSGAPLLIDRQVIGQQQFVLFLKGGTLDTVPEINFVAPMASTRVIDRNFRIEIRNL